MKRVLSLCIVIMTVCIGLNAQELTGDKYLKSIKGDYVELFSSQTCLNPKFDDLWRSETLKYVEASQVDSVIAMFQNQCQGDKIGAEAIEYNTQNGCMQFCCAFLQGVDRFEIKGNRISGYASDGKLTFSHTYHFDELDSNGNYIFESDDNNSDEFRYFWFMPDSPKTTYHIEFRYGSDKAQLSQMTEGKYAYWLAAGVRKGHKNEWRKGIVLFIDERLERE